MKTVKVKQIKSKIGRPKSHQECLKGLRIKRMHQEVEVAVTPESMGMLNKIKYMLVVEGL